MIFARINKVLCCAVVLALLALRLITPAGYMPASAGSGLLFELCPDGLPVAVLSAISGTGHHHHHHADGDDSAAESANDPCPLGHMLSASIAFDDAFDLKWLPARASLQIVFVRLLRRAHFTPYLSRGPPA